MTTLDQLVARAQARRLPDTATRRLIRESAGVSQDELAEALGVTRPTLTRWESGKRRPRGAAADRYAAALNRLREAR